MRSMLRRSQREAAYDMSWQQPGMAGGCARCAECHASLGEIVTFWSGEYGLFLSHGYVPIGERAGLPAYGRRNRARQNRRLDAPRRGQVILLPSGKRTRHLLGSTRPPVITKPVTVYCLNCSAMQRVALPPKPVEPDLTFPTAEEVRMAQA